MKEQTLTVTEAARGFSDLVNRVRYRGESATLTKNGRAVARIVPVEPPPITGAELFKRWKPGATLTPPPGRKNKKVVWPDLQARQQKLFPHPLPGKPASEIVSEGRGEW